MINGFIFVILIIQNPFLPGFRTWCLTRPRWKECHAVCLVKFRGRCLHVQLTQQLQRAYDAFDSRYSALIKQKRAPVGNENTPRHTSNVTDRKTGGTWGAGSDASTYIQSKPCAHRLAPFANHGSSLPWREVQRCGWCWKQEHIVLFLLEQPNCICIKLNILYKDGNR